MHRSFNRYIFKRITNVNKKGIYIFVYKKIQRQHNKYFYRKSKTCINIFTKNQNAAKIFCFSWKNPAPPAEKPLYYMIEKKEDTQVIFCHDDDDDGDGDDDDNNHMSVKMRKRLL